jgi:hypothetical protein
MLGLSIYYEFYRFRGSSPTVVYHCREKYERNFSREAAKPQREEEKKKRERETSFHLSSFSLHSRFILASFSLHSRFLLVSPSLCAFAALRE